MPVPSSITDLSTTAASNSPAGSDNVFPDLDNYLRAYASFVALLRDGKGLSTEVSLASAGTCDVGGAASMFVQITGTTTITSFGTNYLPRILRFAGVLTLTHNATTLILPTGANITTAAGDTCLIVPVGTSGWRVLQYQRASDGSSLFLQAGTSAVTRTVQNKLQETVSVKDFGVVGNGVADDTVAIQACIAAAGIGGTIVFPPGVNCKVSSEINFNVSGQEIRGHGATITKAAAFTGTTVLRISAVNVTLDGLSIDGTDKTADGIITAANAASGFAARNLNVSNCLYGISATSNSNIVIESCDITFTANYSIRSHNIAATQALSGVRILNNYLDRSDADAATVSSGCILVRGDATHTTSDVIISGNRLIHVSDPTDSAALACEMRYINGGVFSENYSKNGAMLVSVALSSNVTVDSNACDGATFYGIEVAGISPTGCYNVAVTGNTIHGRSLLNYAIGLQGTSVSKGCIISGNTIEGTVSYGVFVNDQWDDLTISSNRIDITYGTGTNYGIYLFGTTNVISQVAITGNTLNGNGTGEKAIYLKSVTQATVTGNTGPGWTQNGIYIDGSVATCDEIVMSGNTFNGLSSNAIAKNGTIGNYVSSYNNAPYRRSNTLGCNDFDLNNNVFEAWGTGTPETFVTAGVGSVFHRRDGGAATCLYVKETGTGNTGWVAK